MGWGAGVLTFFKIGESLCEICRALSLLIVAVIWEGITNIANEVQITVFLVRIVVTGTVISNIWNVILIIIRQWKNFFVFDRANKACVAKIFGIFAS
jgi:hypothetical protein